MHTFLEARNTESAEAATSGSSEVALYFYKEQQKYLALTAAERIYTQLHMAAINALKPHSQGHGQLKSTQTSLRDRVFQTLSLMIGTLPLHLSYHCNFNWWKKRCKCACQLLYNRTSNVPNT